MSFRNLWRHRHLNLIILWHNKGPDGSEYSFCQFLDKFYRLLEIISPQRRSRGTPLYTKILNSNFSLEGINVCVLYPLENVSHTQRLPIIHNFQIKTLFLKKRSTVQSLASRDLLFLCNTWISLKRLLMVSRKQNYWTLFVFLLLLCDDKTIQLFLV